MKKFFTTLLLMFVVMGGYAYDVEIDGIYYNLVPKAKEAIVTYKEKDFWIEDYSGSVTIPLTIVYDDITYSVTSVGDCAFADCSGITSLTIPNSVTSIGDCAFAGCSGITSLTIPNSVTCIGYQTFIDCSGLTSLTIPNSVTCIEGEAFRNCSGLTSVIIGNSVTNIEGCVFYDCSGLTSVTIGDFVTSIGYGAFFGCSGLTSITIPNSVKSIGDKAFEGCASLVSVDFGNSVMSIGDQAFANCSDLTSVTIPNSVTSIGNSAFFRCSSLPSVTIPNSVMSIGSSVFCECSGLTSVTIGNSVKSIGRGAFSACSGLASIIIPNSVTSIGEKAFYSCRDLTSVVIGKSVTWIYSEAFANCKNLETFTCLAEKVPSIKTDAFKDSYVNAATLIVPESSLQAYKTTAPWSEFGTFKTVEGGDVPSTPRCATPSIAYENCKLYYVTATPGATVVSNVVVADAKTSYDACVPLSATYNITAYATKSGYDDSDVATATLVWATATFTPGETTNAKEMTIDALPLLITQEDGMVTISGIADGAIVTAYGTNGTTVASAKAIGNAALLNLSDLQGKVAVLNVNGKSAKVAIK